MAAILTAAIVLFCSLAGGESPPQIIRDQYQSLFRSNDVLYDYISHLPGSQHQGRIYIHSREPKETLFQPQHPLNLTGRQPFFEIEYLVEFKGRLYLNLKYPLSPDYHLTRQFEQSLIQGKVHLVFTNNSPAQKFSIQDCQTGGWTDIQGKNVWVLLILPKVKGYQEQDKALPPFQSFDTLVISHPDPDSQDDYLFWRWTKKTIISDKNDKR